MGKVIRFNERGLVVAGIPNKNKPVNLGDYTVTDVLAESKEKYNLEFDTLASMSTLPVLESQVKENTFAGNWKEMDKTYHYVLPENWEKDINLQTILDQVCTNQAMMNAHSTIILKAQPLAEINPGKMYKNPFSYRLPIQVIYFLAGLAAIVILSACFNYTNLSLAKSFVKSSGGSHQESIWRRKTSDIYTIHW